MPKRLINQGRGGITPAAIAGQFDAIGTDGLATCVGLAIQQPVVQGQPQQWGIAHIDCAIAPTNQQKKDEITAQTVAMLNTDFGACNGRAVTITSPGGDVSANCIIAGIQQWAAVAPAGAVAQLAGNGFTINAAGAIQAIPAGASDPNNWNGDFNCTIEPA